MGRHRWPYAHGRLTHWFLGLSHEETSTWKDLHGLYRELFYLLYKERTLETVKKAVKYK